MLICSICISAPVHAAQVCATNGGSGWAIADNTTNNATEMLNFGDAVSDILDLTVDVDISHTYIGDLDATLTSPTGQSVELFNRPGYTGTGFGCSRNNILATFSDTGTTNAENECANPAPAVAGTFLAHNSSTTAMTAFDGANNPNGNWTLAVTDNAGGDTGTINSYCLNVDIAALSLTKYASTNATCSDTLTSITVADGTDVYYCYTVTNTGDYSITIAAGAITDDQGIDISSLEGTYGIAGSGTETNAFVAGPYTAGSSSLLPLNATTTNTAAVSATWASGTLSTSKQASVTVLPSTPSSGNKPLYLDSSPATDALTRVAVTTATSVTLTPQTSNTWTLANVTKDLLIDGSGTIPITLMLSETGNGTWRDFTMTLKANGGTETIASLSVVNEPLPGTAAAFSYALVMDSTWTAGDNTVNSGQDITLTVTNDRATGSGRDLLIQDMGSQVTLPALTVINVDSVVFYDNPAVTQTVKTCTGSTVTVRATVSDPFGSADINPPAGPGLPSIALTGVTAAPASGTMTLFSEDVTAGTRTYDFTTTVSGSGTLNADVTASEGFEGTITNTRRGYLPVINGTASLTIAKAANKASAKPGELITYTVTVAHTGSSSCPATAAELSDKLSRYSAFGLNTFGAGTPFSFNLTNTSGASTLALGTPDYASTGPVWSKPLVDGAGGAPAGYDGLVTNWKAPFTGDLQVGDSFTLQYGATTK